LEITRLPGSRAGSAWGSSTGRYARDDIYRKEVAIKVASQGLLTSAGLQRFLDERQILAGLDHPNIARIMDGGSTAARAPYLVMEFVSGKPIHAWCEESRLSVRDRVVLFLQVCRAVEHAHRQLVVQRDLKPDNIFVTPDGTPKLPLRPACAQLSEGTPQEREIYVR
jgi:serine/threonine protein kinase